MDSAFRQFEGNERLLRTAILSILAFVVSYAALTMLAWTSWAWTAGPAEVQNDLPFMVLFEGAIAGLAVAGVSLVHRRRHDLDSLRRQNPARAPTDPAPTSPLARAEMRAGVLRGMSRQVDSLLLWTPFAIVLTEWTGLTLWTKLAPGAWTRTPLDRTLDLAIVTLGVPLAVAIFGVGILLSIRSST
ncbi:MAG: hypothetical protein L3J91_02205, partial [Thermoplasmata archaeon]|nr:hypothetical protein [Thermoplasmata archaeon]